MLHHRGISSAGWIAESWVWRLLAQGKPLVASGIHVMMHIYFAGRQGLPPDQNLRGLRLSPTPTCPNAMLAGSSTSGHPCRLPCSLAAVALLPLLLSLLQMDTSAFPVPLAPVSAVTVMSNLSGGTSSGIALGLLCLRWLVRQRMTTLTRSRRSCHQCA